MFHCGRWHPWHLFLKLLCFNLYIYIIFFLLSCPRVWGKFIKTVATVAICHTFVAIASCSTSVLNKSKIAICHTSITSSFISPISVITPQPLQSYPPTHILFKQTPYTVKQISAKIQHWKISLRSFYTILCDYTWFKLFFIFFKLSDKVTLQTETSM